MFALPRHKIKKSAASFLETDSLSILGSLKLIDSLKRDGSLRLHGSLGFFESLHFFGALGICDSFTLLWFSQP